MKPTQNTVSIGTGGGGGRALLNFCDLHPLTAEPCHPLSQSLLWCLCLKSISTNNEDTEQSSHQSGLV